ncbi:MAG: hypothetical protein KC482_01355 [Dehalococcoidia bacterium]|nr:hypothetical protein [Dehalococcoidia bacterium]
MGHSELLFLVDVDGVVTDEHARVDATVVRQLATFIGEGAGVAFVTGRSRSWLESQLVPLLAASRPTSIHAAVLAAEMGAVRLVEGEWHISEEHAVVEPARSELKLLANQTRYATLLEWDRTKEATATFEALHDPDVPGHAERAREALAALMDEVRPIATARGYRAALSTYALDVLTPSLSKAVGAQFAIDTLGGGDGFKRVLVFGDSVGDMEMARTAGARLDVPVTFFWLGRGAPPGQTDGIEVRSAVEPHAPGTRQLLGEF